MRTVLVTGGAGYIGSHTCKALAAQGYLPVVYDNLSRGHRSSVKWGPFEEGDILDYDRLLSILNEYNPEAVIHFAAFAYVGESVEHPAMYYWNNVVGSQTLLEAMRAHEVNKIVFSSTCATYGIPDRIPIIEDAPQHPINPYGASKLMVERMLQDYGAAYNFRSVCLRYFNAGGSDPDGEIGEMHDPEPHLIPLVLRAALGLRPTISIFGDDYDTPDGTCIRDYIHVTDLADAHVQALDYLLRGETSVVFNLGNGKGFSVKEVIETARLITGRMIAEEVCPRRPGDPAVLVSAAEKAACVLNWKPKYKGLDVQILHAWKWMLHDGIKC